MKPLPACKFNASVMNRKTNPLHPWPAVSHPFATGMFPGSHGCGQDGRRSRSPKLIQWKDKTMKYVTMIARYLLGLMFLVFGSNVFLKFIPMGPMPAGLAGQFMGALFAAHYFYVVGAIMVVSAILLSGEPVCGAGADAAGSGAVQHPSLSSHNESRWHWHGRVCNSALAAGCLGASDCV